MIGVLRERRTIRRFSTRKIEPEKTAILQEMLLRSPSGKNICPWEFSFIDNPDLINLLRKCRPSGTKSLETAPLAVVICADETMTDTWVEDCTIAAVLLQVSAQSLGLGSCWVQIRNRYSAENKTSEDFVRELLKIPLNLKVQCLIAVGYPDEIKESKPMNSLHFDKIRWNKF